MAALFVAFSIVAAVLIEKQTATAQVTRQADMQAQLSRISNALLQYYIFAGGGVNNSYPCPAPINAATNAAAYGVAASPCNTASTIPSGLTSLPGAFTAGVHAGDNYIRGMVPVITLAPYGITMNDAIDSWGNRIMYVVDRGLTVAGSPPTALGGATLTDWRLTGANATLATPDFLVFSYGRDKMGATPRDSTAVKIACGAAGSIRTNNCRDDQITFTTGPSNTGTNVGAANYFDDIVSSYTH